MKKQIISVVLMGFIVFNIIGCGETTVEDKKRQVEKLQQEIIKEEAIEIKEDVSKEDWVAFRTVYDEFMYFENETVLKEWSSNDKSDERKSELENQIESYEEKLIALAPPEFEDCIKEIFLRNEDVVQFSFENTYSDELVSQRNELVIYMIEEIDKLKKSFEEYDEKYEY